MAARQEWNHAHVIVVIHPLTFTVDGLALLMPSDGLTYSAYLITEASDLILLKYLTRMFDDHINLTRTDKVKVLS